MDKIKSLNPELEGMLLDLAVGESAKTDNGDKVKLIADSNWIIGEHGVEDRRLTYTVNGRRYNYVKRRVNVGGQYIHNVIDRHEPIKRTRAKKA